MVSSRRGLERLGRAVVGGVGSVVGPALPAAPMVHAPDALLVARRLLQLADEHALQGETDPALAAVLDVLHDVWGAPGGWTRRLGLLARRLPPVPNAVSDLRRQRVARRSSR